MNAWLTKGSHAVLKLLLESEDREITWEKGAGYWIGYKRVGSRGVEDLLRLCLLRKTYSDNRETYIVYEASSEVEHVLSDENYTPAIIIAQRTGEPQIVQSSTRDIGSRYS